MDRAEAKRILRECFEEENRISGELEALGHRREALQTIEGGLADLYPGIALEVSREMGEEA
ncbi:MAG TPA: hypothetical protein VK386_07010, partial [Acidimicrobiales bacterium]|nr:hypothetical protein [Acidimicrobiales bacterium]